MSINFQKPLKQLADKDNTARFINVKLDTLAQARMILRSTPMHQCRNEVCVLRWPGRSRVRAAVENKNAYEQRSEPEKNYVRSKSKIVFSPRA